MGDIGLSNLNGSLSGSRILVFEESPLWTAEKAALLGKYSGCFNLDEPVLGNLLGGSWFRVIDHAGRFVGLAWWALDLDAEVRTAEISIALESPGEKKGGEVLARLEDRGRDDDIEIFVATVRPEHPAGKKVKVWLSDCGYSPQFQDFPPTPSDLHQYFSKTIAHGPEEG